MEKVHSSIYLKELALPNSPLKYLNLFIIRGDSESIIIDTGFNMEETREEMDRVFAELNLKPENTILFLTHLHSDHTGLASYLEEKGVKVFISRTDGEILNNSVSIDDTAWLETVEHGKLQGLEADRLSLQDNPGFKYRPTGHINYIPAVPGQFFRIGNYDFEVVDLKGHTLGILGLYEKKHKILFCGDHILGKISPNITFWGFEYGDILGTYLESLERVYHMDIDYLFSSHRALVKDHRERIDQLKTHHRQRLNEARQALATAQRATVREVTKQLHWDIRSKSWDDFPASQKWFAAGEAHAHLEHLRAKGEARMEIVRGVCYYSLIV